MTRLKSADIENLTSELQAYDERLRESIGMALAELACAAADISTTALDWSNEIRVAAVPVTSGKGVIGHFSQTLAAIAAHLGFSAEVTRLSDVAGLAEAYQRSFDIILAADDNVFCAINTRNGKVVDNSESTGRGFAHGLAGLAGGLAGKPVLVLGCGPVGLAGMRAIAGLGGRVTVYDPVEERCLAAVRALSGMDIKVAESLDAGLAGHSLIFEATPVGGVLGGNVINTRTCVAAPGVPCGVTDEAAARLGRRLLWDPLQIGVAAMLMEAAFATERRVIEKIAA